MYTSLYFEADARPPAGSFLAPVQLRRLDYDGVRKWGRPLPGQPQLHGKRRFERPRRGRTIKDAPLARETVEQLDDFAGWIKAKRVELAPRASCPLSRKAERWPVAGWGDGRQPRKSEIRKLCEARGCFGNERGSGNVSRCDG